MGGTSPAAGRRLAVLASGAGSNLQAILEACAAGSIAGEVVLVVANRPDVGALERAARAGVRTVTLVPMPGETRPDYDTRLADVVAAAHPDLVVLAGWMRILSMAFLGRFPSSVINLHPALPGELSGTHAIERAHREALAGQRTRTGVMVHLVPDEGVDDGPVLATVEVPIDRGESVEALTERVHAAEHRLLVETLAALCAGDAPTSLTPLTAEASP